jgi:hypothetical protein
VIPSRFRIKGKTPLKELEVAERSGIGVQSFAQFVMLEHPDALKSFNIERRISRLFIYDELNLVHSTKM